MATDHLTYLALKNALETAIKYGGGTGKLISDNLYNAVIEALDFAGLQRQKTVISAALIQNCFTTPVEVNPAPGADKVRIPVMICAVKEAGDAFSGGNDCTIVTNHGSTALITLPFTGFFDQTSRTIYFASSFANVLAEENQNFILKSSKDMSAAGGSEVHVYMFYRELELS